MSGSLNLLLKEYANDVCRVIRVKNYSRDE